MGSIGIPSIAAAYTSIPKSMIPVATTALNILQRLGGPIATTSLAISLHVHWQAESTKAFPAFAATFWLLCAIHALAVFSALRLSTNRANREVGASSEKIELMDAVSD